MQFIFVKGHTIFSHYFVHTIELSVHTYKKCQKISSNRIYLKHYAAIVRVYAIIRWFLPAQNAVYGINIICNIENCGSPKGLHNFYALYMYSSMYTL